MSKGVDLASTVSPTLAAYLKANGYSFVIRYLDDSFGRSWKTTKQDELAVIHDAGLGYIPVFETTGATGVDDTPAGAAYLTMNQGMYDAQHALAELEQLGYPKGYPVVFAVDTDLPGPDLFSLIAYTTGLKDVVQDQYTIWVYGPWDVLAYCEAACKQQVKGFWQAYAPAWSQGRNASPFPNADLRQTQNGQQMAGTLVDLDESLAWEGWKKEQAMTPEDKQWFLDNVTKPLSDQANSGFNTTLPTMLRRSMVGLDPFSGQAPRPDGVPADAVFSGAAKLQDYVYADGSQHFWLQKPDGTWYEAGTSAISDKPTP